MPQPFIIGHVTERGGTALATPAVYESPSRPKTARGSGHGSASAAAAPEPERERPSSWMNPQRDAGFSGAGESGSGSGGGGGYGSGGGGGGGGGVYGGGGSSEGARSAAASAAAAATPAASLRDQWADWDEDEKRDGASPAPDAAARASAAPQVQQAYAGGVKADSSLLESWDD